MARTSTSDLKTLQELLMWARKNGIALQSVQVGTIAIVGHDRKLDNEFVSPGPAREEAKQNILEQYAGDLLPQMQNGHTEDDGPTIEDD